MNYPTCGDLWIIYPNGKSYQVPHSTLEAERVVASVDRGGYIVVRHVYAPQAAAPHPSLPHVNMSMV